MIIAPSILSADFGNLAQDIMMLNKSEADWLHVDVMDGVFVPNISFGFPIVKILKKESKKPLDVHLMITQPERYVKEFIESGANYITVHYEASIHLYRTISLIKEFGAKVGVAINPHTSVEVLEDIINELDLVLIMSVNPGFGGQRFIENTYTKIKKLKNIITRKNASTLIEVDGGVTLENTPLLKEAGADILVAGHTVFSSKNPTEMISKLKQI